MFSVALACLFVFMFPILWHYYSTSDEEIGLKVYRGDYGENSNK